MPGFPQLNLKPQTSPDAYAPRREADGAAGLAQFAGEADQLGRTLNDMATVAARREGADAAAADVANGAVQPKGDDTVRGEAYDAVAKNYLSAQRQAQLAESMQGAYEASPNSPVELGKSMDAIRAGLGKTGFPELDAALDGHFLVRRADFMARAIAGAKAATVAQDKSNFVTDLSTGQDLLDQTAAGASADANGGARISGAAQLFVQSLAKYGPKEAFDVAGVHFDPDPNRRAALEPADIGRTALAAISQARKTWILSTAQQLSDEGSRKMFAAQVMAKWEAGDPSFAGLDGKDMDTLQRQLEAGADRARADANAARADNERQARDAIDAFTWGGNPDFDAALTNAKASGNPALVAQVEFYRSADEHTRGVLRSVVARQLGLLGPAGGQEQVVDAKGQPVAIGADPQALAASIRQDAPGFFGKLIGQPVTITSAQRTPAHNAEVGGAPNSAHLAGDAWDIVAPGLTSAQVMAKLRQAGVPFDQLIDEHDHVHFGLGPQMRGQAMIKNGDAWTTPPGVQPGTPAYVAWASAREGFAGDPMKYVRGGASQPPIANVPALVPDGAFAGGDVGAAWGQTLAKRQALGQSISRSYGVPPRMLDNGEVEYYKAKIAQDPRAGIQLAQAAERAVGPAGAISLLKELGQSDPTANVNLHIADLAAKGNALVAQKAVLGLQLAGEGRTLPDANKRDLQAQFDAMRGAVPPQVLGAAYATAHAAWIADQTQGQPGDAATYAQWALGRTGLNGIGYGGPAKVNGAMTVLPSWLNPDKASLALHAAGDAWAKAGTGPVWSNGAPVTGDQLAGMRLALQPRGTYRFVDPKSGQALKARTGGAFEPDLDVIRGYLGRMLGSDVIRPGT